MNFYRDEDVMDFVEIWLDGPIPVDRDDVEDALNEALTEIGEVIGAGTSERGSHLDVEVDEAIAENVVLSKIFALLDDLGVGDSVRVRPGDGDVWIRLSEWSGRNAATGPRQPGGLEASPIWNGCGPRSTGTGGRWSPPGADEPSLP